MVQVKGLACRGQPMIFSQSPPFLSTLLPRPVRARGNISEIESERPYISSPLLNWRPGLGPASGPPAAQTQIQWYDWRIQPSSRLFTKGRLSEESGNTKKSVSLSFSHQREDFTLPTQVLKRTDDLWPMSHDHWQASPCHLQGMKYSETIVL